MAYLKLMVFLLAISCFPPKTGIAQKKSTVKINYLLSVDSSDLSRFKIDMQVKNISRNFSVAMVTHPEYDDRFWRYVRNIRVNTASGEGKITRVDSAVWNISIPGNTAVIHYEIELPAATNGQRPSWRPFLTSAGGLTGDLHSFMYVPGQTNLPLTVELKLPKGWKAASSMKTGTGPLQFIARSGEELADAPILIGNLHTWTFTVDNIPHRISFLPTKQISFDTVKTNEQIKQIVSSARDLFGKLPYSSYDFLLVDDAYGGLEHRDCVLLGLTDEQVAADPQDFLSELSHEYFHAWNLVRIKPIEWTTISYKTPVLSKVLWWSEGLTLFYSDLLLRRAHLPTYDSTRMMHLATVLNNYYSNAGNRHFSAEQVSLTANGPNGMLGNYTASTHTQGEVLGTMLDIIIRNKTNGGKSIDDVMRKMMTDFGNKKGIRSADIANAIRSESGYDATDFFRDHIYGKLPVDLNKYLAYIGLKVNVTWIDAIDEKGMKIANNRLFVWKEPGSAVYKIQLFDPESCWVKAGIHTGDTVVSMNGKDIHGNRDLFSAVQLMMPGDKVRVKVVKAGQARDISVDITGFKNPQIQITQRDNISPGQKKLFLQWAAAR